ncbi:lysophospholipid acyltransferase family protein [Acidomonas methanolica]|uniref:lysophospholipid acyltransferase family protein n=1 Tax=Acidomonas methanolica TaxID=437 RepID=UPI00211A45D1|nr:lauroyl acyltransferase [Acidomonas methanolica]MCQ9154849.1 lauroyl acyltransferase [Acidomonas methanolica]
MPDRNSARPRFIHYLEAAAARAALGLLRRLPPATASNLGGAVTRTIGPLLPVSRVAERNLRLALPELDAAARRRIVRQVWDNLGRTAAEFPHLARLNECEGDECEDNGPGWRVINAHHLRDVAALDRPALFISGHIGNWEVLPPAVARYGMPFASFYRAAANPLVDRLIADMRRDAMKQDVPNFPKGALGARQALRHVAQGGHLGILADQKMNDGIEARFFGLPAMTPSAAAIFALRHDCPIVTGRVRRVGPARFEVIVDQPLFPDASGDRAADVARLTQAINDRLEAAIRAEPGAWLWLHRRWPKHLTP